MEPLTSPLFHHRRKPSVLSTSNGLSFSGKDDYGDLLSGGNKKTKFRRGVAVEEYGEIFGGGVAGGGRGSSIPVLDLSDLDRANGSGEYRSSNEGQLDYSRIFGGFDVGGGDTAAGGVPPYEELFGKVQKSKQDKAKPRATADLGGSPMKNPDNGGGGLSDAPSQFCDGAKQVNVSYHKTSQPSKDGSNGTTHIAQLNAVSGFTRFVHRDTHQDHDNGIQPKESVINDKRNAIDELSDVKSGRRAKWKAEKEQNARQASEHISNGKDDTNRNMSEVNTRLFHSGEVGTESLKVAPPSSSPIDQSQSRPNGKLFYSGELDLKSRPSKVPLPSSSSDQLNDNKVPLNQSKSFAFGSKVDSPEKDKGGYFSPSDEELDVDSAAAISAAALKKAVQQAQESIRLAKEIMERKRDRMKTRSRSALKVKDVKETKHDQHVISVAEKNMKDVKEIKHDQHVISVAEKNMKDAFDVLDTKVQVHTEYDQKNVGGNVKVASAVKDGEAMVVNRNVEVQKPVENAEAVEGGGMSVWITQVLNNGKNKLAAFASQLAENKNNTSVPEKSEKVEDAELTKAAVTTLETKNREKMDNVSSFLRPKAAEREPSTTDSDTCISNSDASVKDNNLKAQVLDKFEEGGKSGEKLDCQVTIDGIKLESENFEKDHPVIETPELVGSIDEGNMVFKLEKDVEIHNVVSGFEEIGSRIDAVDTGRNLGEFCQVVDNDGKPNTANGKETDDKKLEDVAEIWSECYSQQETDEQMPIHTHNEAVNQIFTEEECSSEGLNQRTPNKHQYEANDLGHRDAVENQEIDVEEELKDNDCADGEMDEGREGSKTGAWPEYAHDNHLNSSFDSHDSDNINMPSEKSEPCGHSMNSYNEQVSELEDCGFVKDNYLTGDEEQACELDGRNSEENADIEFEENENLVEQEVEEAFGFKESKLCETSYLRNNEGDDLVREVDEEQVEQAVEDAFRSKKSEFYEESYLDVNNEEGDVLQTSERENEAIDDNECEVDEKEVEQAVEGAFGIKQKKLHDTYNIDQSSVHGDVMEAIVKHVSEVFASTGKRDNVGAATASDEESICEEELPTDVNLLRINAFIHNDSEEHGIDSDSDKDKSIPETSMPNIEIIDVRTRISFEEEDDHPNSVAGSENTTAVHESDVCVDNIMEDVDDAAREDGEKASNVEDHQEVDMVQKREEPNLAMPNDSEGCQEHLETDSVMETGQKTECSEDNLALNRTKRESGETREAVQKETERSNFNNDYLKKIEMAMRERERQNRIAVERAIREARERAFAEARERAERASVEKANAEARQRANAAAREKLGKLASGTKVSTDSKLKAERSAVERATAEARERALEKAMSQKTNSEARAPGGKVGAGKSPSVSPDSESSGESNNESAQRRKARLERHQRIMERAANALAEKNMRDVLAQREQNERNRIAETLDAEIKRWSNGKEGNLRALLSTLQYILGANSGWQPITLTEMLTTSAVKKAYRKATLYVHPDKLQQRGASIHQKYICEKVFDLLQAAWSKFNSEER